MMVMNVLTYAFSLVSAHLLGPESFGAVSALLGVLIVANVGALALQATAARRIATAAADVRSAVTHDVLRGTWLTSSALTVLLLVLAPLFAQVLQVSLVAALMLGASNAPLTFMGGYAGVLQGARTWRWLAATYVAMGMGRIIGGGAALLVDRSVTSAMVGVAIGSAVPALVGWVATRGIPHRDAASHAPIMREVWRNGHSLLAFFVLTNLDVLLARYLFDQVDAGVYAAGAIIAKSCLFLPQFVIIVAFPSMAESHAGGDRTSSWLKPLGFVTLLGLLVVAGTWLLPDLAVTFIGGDDYSALGDHAWLFALEGTSFAVLQMLLYRQIARQVHVAYYVWTAVVVLAVGALVLPVTNVWLVTLVVAVVVGVAGPLALARPARGARPTVSE